MQMYVPLKFLHTSLSLSMRCVWCGGKGVRVPSVLKSTDKRSPHPLSLTAFSCWPKDWLIVYSCSKLVHALSSSIISYELV